MAYVSKDKKAKIKAALDKVIPKGWKWSLAVRHHSTAVLTIYSAPVDLIGEWTKVANKFRTAEGWHPLPVQSNVGINEHHLDKQFEGKLLEVFSKIKEAMNVDNHDNSDPMTDYFDVGHYVDIRIGRYDKPFVYTGRGEPYADFVADQKDEQESIKQALEEDKELPKDSMERGFPHKKKPLF